MSKIVFIDEVDISNKRIFLRVDFNVSLNPDGYIADDMRIRQALPTINYLLQKNNTLIIVSHLGNPKVREEKFSLKPVANRLQSLLTDYKVELVEDFLSPFEKNNKVIFLLENIRFYPEEKANDLEFAKKLAGLAEVYVEDGFGVCHRQDVSIVSVPKFLPGYGGLLLKKEIEMIDRVINNPKKPVVAILGGAKVSTKIGLVDKFLDIADYILIGGAMANTFLKARGENIGKSLIENDFVNQARSTLEKGRDKIFLPEDSVVSQSERTIQHTPGVCKGVGELSNEDNILDIGVKTREKFTEIIEKCRTVIWNGPMGYFENPAFAHGTESILQAVVKNEEAVSVVGGGDTLNAISANPDVDKITHLSTGGGAMLEYIEKGTLPGIEALTSSNT